MTITIGIKDLIYAIRMTSHNEVGHITDAEVRYKVEAGLDKIELIKQCIMEAYSSVLMNCHRFIMDDNVDDINPAVPDTSETINNETEIGISDFVFNIDGGVRRLGGKSLALANKIREALKDYALCNFYVSVSAQEQAKAHASLANADMVALNQMLLEKRPPKYL